jgi:hypothetical protein
VGAWPPGPWSGWWADPAPADPAPVVAEVEPAAPADAARPRLSRRVPQAHLAPGLRIIPNRAEPEPPAPATGDGLSRYQASRAAARTAVEDGGGGVGGVGEQVSR